MIFIYLKEHLKVVLIILLIQHTADLGYIGINKITNGNTPYKKSKKHPLTEKEEEYNKELAKERIYID